jgi:hypothetical protein
MGGSGSGRPRSRANLSDVIRLDALKFVRFVDNEATLSVNWTNGSPIKYLSHADKHKATLVYKSRANGKQSWRSKRGD